MLTIPPSVLCPLNPRLQLAVYQASDAPRYFRGNTIILAIVCFNVFIA